MKRTKWELPLAALLVGTVVLSGCSSNSAAATTQAMNVTVKVSQAQKGLIGKGDIYTGTVTPSETVNIVPKMGGKVVSLPVDIGTEVKKGQVLLKLEDNDLRNNLAKAQADVAAAGAAVKTAQDSQQSGMVSANSGVVSSKSGIISSKSAIDQATGSINQANGSINQATTAVEQAKTAVSSAANNIKQTTETLSAAQKTLTRTQSLFQNGLATQAQLEQAQTAQATAQTANDNAKNAQVNAQEQLNAAQKALVIANKNLNTAQSAYQNATSSYENANSGYSNAQKQLEVSQSTSGIEASQQKQKQAELNVNIAQDALDDAVVTSPINGIIGTKNAEVGEMASTSSPALVIANLSTVNTLIYVPADQINNVKIGDPVQVRVTSSNILKTGKVKNISPLDDSGKGYPVKIAVSNNDNKLKSGMLADISFVDASAKEGIIVPSKAIQTIDGKSYVYVVQKNVAMRKQVTLGKATGSQVFINSGLNDGDTVVTNNLALLEDKNPITVSQ